MMTGMFAHVLDTGRRLLRRPRVALIAVCLLGPCFGAGLAVFHAVDGMLFRALPYGHSDNLFLVQQRNLLSGRAAGTISAAEYTAIAESDRIVGATAFWSVGDASIGQG